VTSDAGLFAYRERDDALGSSSLAGDRLADARPGKNGHHALVGMHRQSVFGRLAGYDDVNDAELLRHDPAIRWIIEGNAAQGSAASPSVDGSIRDELAGKVRKPCNAHRSLWSLDQSSRASIALPYRAGHGFEREPDARRAREDRLERRLWHVFPSAVRVRSMR
jgi:hypothetical protein